MEALDLTVLIVSYEPKVKLKLSLVDYKKLYCHITMSSKLPIIEYLVIKINKFQAGVMITCKSTGKDKFKIVFFDQEVINTFNYLIN